MHIPIDEARKDDAIYSYRDVLKELKFCAYDVPHRNETTNEVLRFFAWLFRSALKLIEDKDEEINRMKAKQPKIIRCKDCRYNCWQQGHETPLFWTPCREIKPEGRWFCWCGAAKDGEQE